MLTAKAIAGACALVGVLVWHAFAYCDGLDCRTLAAARWVTERSPIDWGLPPRPDPRYRHLVMTYSEHSAYTSARAERWRALNPGTTVEVYDDSDCVAFIREVYKPGWLELWAWLPPGPIRADLFRVLYVYARGGVYVDIDAHPVATLAHMYAGAQAEPYLYVPRSRHQDQLNPMIMMASPRHPTLGAALQVYARLFETQAPFSYWRYSVVHVMSALQLLQHPVQSLLVERCPGVWPFQRWQNCRLMAGAEVAVINRGDDWDMNSHAPRHVQPQARQ